jgi:hypothetical protein
LDLDLIETRSLTSVTIADWYATNGRYSAFVTDISTNGFKIDVYNETMALSGSISINGITSPPSSFGKMWFGGLAIDSSNNVYITAYTESYPFPFAPAYSRVWKYTSAGGFVWRNAQVNTASSVFPGATSCAISSNDDFWVLRTGSLERWSPTGTPIILGAVGTPTTPRSLAPDDVNGMWITTTTDMWSPVTVRRINAAMNPAFTPFLLQSNSIQCMFSDGANNLWCTGPFVQQYGNFPFPKAGPLIRWSTSGGIVYRWESGPDKPRPLFWHNGQYGASLNHQYGVANGDSVFVAGVRTRSYA